METPKRWRFTGKKGFSSLLARELSRARRRRDLARQADRGVFIPGTTRATAPPCARHARAAAAPTGTRRSPSFAITHHRVRHDRAMKASILDELPGVGPARAGAAAALRLTGRDPVGIAGAARGTVGGLGYSSRASCTGLGCEQGDRDCRLAFTVLLECDHLSRDPCCTGAAILGDLELGAQLVMTSEQPSPGAVQPDLRAGALAGGERDRVGSERHGSP